MPVKMRCLVPAFAAAVVGLFAHSALAHDGDKGNAGSEGPTPGGLPGSSFSRHGMGMLSRLDLTQLGAPGANANSNLASAWGWVDTLGNLDPSDDREYALMARTSDLAIVDITIPTAPVLIGNVQRSADTNPTTWRDVRVVGNWAFIGVDGNTGVAGVGHGIQAFDLTQVRGVTTPTLFEADAVFKGISNSHTLAVNHTASTPYVYAVGSNTRGGITETPTTAGGMQIIDVNDPMNMAITSSWQADGYFHESSIFTYSGPDTDYLGKEISFNATGNANDPSTAPNSISITDVTNPALPIRISLHSYPQTGYAHQGWLSEDQRYFFINDELDEVNHLTGDPPKTRTHMYDLADLDNPVYRGFFEWGIGAIDHNLYVAGDYIFQAHYTRGVRVFEIGDLESLDPNDWLTEVAWFDTYPANDGATFNGVWQVYPYFPSGSIITSDINGGLFVLQIPEPGSLALLSLGALALLRRRR